MDKEEPLLSLTNNPSERPKSPNLKYTLQNNDSFPLEEIINKYLRDELLEIPSSKKIFFIRLILGLMGSIWGVPWMTASGNAARILPEGPGRDFLRKLFSTGIVITVGGDGLWLMLTLGDALKAKYPEEKILIANVESKLQHGLRLTNTTILSLLSCVSSVFAAFKYNSGNNKFLSIIILFVNFCYGLYGYSVLIEKIIHRIKLLKYPEYSQLSTIKERWLLKLHCAIESNINIPNDIKESKQFIKFIDQLNIQDKMPDPGKLRIKKTGQAVSSIPVVMVATIVSFYLSKEAANETVTTNEPGSIILSIFAELPGFVINVISTFVVSGELYDLLSCQKESWNQTVDHSIARKVKVSVAFIVSLGAPTAAAYITYTTLQDQSLNQGLILAGAAAISMVRIIFSNFTLSNLFDKAISFFNQCRGISQNEKKKEGLKRLHNILSQTKPYFFGEIRETIEGVDKSASIPHESKNEKSENILSCCTQ